MMFLFSPSAISLSYRIFINGEKHYKQYQRSTTMLFHLLIFTLLLANKCKFPGIKFETKNCLNLAQIAISFRVDFGLFSRGGFWSLNLLLAASKNALSMAGFAPVKLNLVTAKAPDCRATAKPIKSPA